MSKGRSTRTGQRAGEPAGRAAEFIRAATSGKSGRVKPAKPRPDFPLFPHATGRWAKKINGRFAFFGPWEDPTAALEMYLAQRDALYAGRLPRRISAAAASGRSAASSTASATVESGTGRGVQVRDLANHFLTAKQRRVAGGEMGLRSFSEYHKACERLVKQFGAGRVVDDLDADDFGRLRASLATTRGPVTLGNEIGRIRSVFKYAYEAGLVDKPMRFGPDFMKPAKRSVRLARQARGPRMFEPTEIKALLAAARVQMRAMILLGLNCGMGNTDVATLTWGGLDLKKGFVELPRPKTGIARRAVLWPETIKALELVRKARSERDGMRSSDTPFSRARRIM